MRTVGSAESVGRIALQFGRHRRQIAFGQHHVRVEDEHVVALRALHTVVARLSGSGVGLGEVLYAELLRIFLADILARHRRTVLHYHHFEVGFALTGEAVEQFVHLVRTVVNGNYYAVFHFFLS